MMQDLINQIKVLTDRVNDLELQASGKSHGADFEEIIRNIVFFDQDSKTSTGTSTSVVTGVNFGAQTVTTASVSAIGNAAKFVRIYFRGQAYNMPVYTIS